MTYLTRYLQEHVPDLEITVHQARYSERPVLKHLSVPFALSVFAISCLRQRIDIVHLNVAPRGSTWRKMLYAVTALGLGRRVVVHLHGSGYDQFYQALSPWRKTAVRMFFARATKVVVLSSYWKRFMLSEVGVLPSKVVEIANGVPSIVEPVKRIRSDVATIVFLGHVGHRKGIDVLVDALADLAHKGLRWTAIVGGNGDVEAATARARDAGIAHNIAFLGWVGEKKVDELLRLADIFVLPSRAENQPVAILEAMARATPVVATNVGAIPEQVVHGETGLLVAPGVASALSDALETLIRSRALRVSLGNAGLKRFQELYSVQSCAERFAKLYRSL
jgi:glycosyltransferase involved in cell wall biosynthesis